MLFVELEKVENGWLWHNDMTDNMPELELGCFGKLAVGKAKGKMGSIDGGEEPTAWYV
jgi:hypothetical protein